MLDQGAIVLWHHRSNIIISLSLFHASPPSKMDLHSTNDQPITPSFQTHQLFKCYRPPQNNENTPSAHEISPKQTTSLTASQTTNKNTVPTLKRKVSSANNSTPSTNSSKTPCKNSSTTRAPSASPPKSNISSATTKRASTRP